MGGILTGSNTPPFGVLRIHVGVYVLFVCAAGVSKKKKVFWRLPFQKKKDKVILSLPLNAAEIYEIGKLATLWSR